MTAKIQVKLPVQNPHESSTSLLDTTKRKQRKREISAENKRMVLNFWTFTTKRLLQEWRQYWASARWATGIESRSRVINGRA